MGFQDMHPVVRKAAQSKGGSVRKRKGIGSQTPERRREIASLGGKAKHENHISGEASQLQKESQSDNLPNLADILGALDEQVQK